MRKIIFAIILLMSGFYSWAQLDYSKYVEPVHKGIESTGLSIYDTNSEKVRPIHVGWFDDNSMFGVDTEDRERVYFILASNAEDRYEAVFIDLTDLPI